MRLFIAASLPVSVIEMILTEIYNLQKTVNGVTWVQSDALHCTIKFLGEVCDYSLIDKALTAVTFTQSDALLSDSFQVFCRGDRASAIILPFRDPGALIRIYTSVENVLSNIGIVPESRTFIPHVTVGRFKKSVSCDEARSYLSSAAIPYSPHIPTGTIHLVRSTLLPTGPKYDILCSYGR